MENPKLTATFDGDSKRFHRFIIDEGQELVGMLCGPKGEDIPDQVTVELRTKQDNKPRGRRR